MSLLAPQPTGGNYYYQYPQYGYQPGWGQPTVGDQVSRTVDQFSRGISDMTRDISRSINGASSDMQTSFRRMERAWNGEPEYSIGRIASWGAGAMAVFKLADSSMRYGATGLVAVACVGLGALAGNWAYDWFMDRFGKNFGY